MDRRQFAVSALTATLLPGRFGQQWAAGRSMDPTPEADLAAIERRVAGQLGVAFLDTGSGRHLEFHGDGQFPMCSTFKWLLAARVLTRVDKGEEDLARFIKYSAKDFLAYAPITKQHLSEGGMTVSALAEAAVEYSDNTAANLLLDTVGGPAGLTAWLRAIGDQQTRLDRKEPELNESIPGDQRDMTTPSAMVADLRTILLGRMLSESSRDRLTGWLVANTTGNARLRAGLPAGWKVGDKTGTGDNGSTNDLGIIWPTSRAPVLVAAYLTGTKATTEESSAALADVARVMVAWLGAS